MALDILVPDPMTFALCSVWERGGSTAVAAFEARDSNTVGLHRDSNTVGLHRDSNTVGLHRDSNTVGLHTPTYSKASSFCFVILMP